MESIPLLYKIIFIVVINTIVVSLVAYLLCKNKVRREVKSLTLPSVKPSEIEKDKQTIEIRKNETETPRQYQKSISVVEEKKIPTEKKVKEEKRQKFLRYTPFGYIDIEEDKNKKTSKWR